MDESLRSLAALIITGLHLEDITPEDIDPQAPLFGAGLGLDSIDALELALLVTRNYKVSIGDADTGKKAFSSLSALHHFIRDHQPSNKS